MKIPIDSIGRTGRDLELALPADRVAAALGEAGTGFTPAGALQLSGSLSLVGKAVRVSGHLEGQLFGACRRCLTTTSVALAPALELILRPATASEPQGLPGKDRQELGSGESAGSFGLDEADEDVYQGDTLDLWPLLREQVLLALPDYLLCRDACKGLCQVCGVNLNEESCGCERAIPDPRLAGLKDIKLS